MSASWRSRPWAETRGLGVRVAAGFNLSNDKRGTLDAVLLICMSMHRHRCH